MLTMWQYSSQHARSTLRSSRSPEWCGTYTDEWQRTGLNNSEVVVLSHHLASMGRWSDGRNKDRGKIWSIRIWSRQKPVMIGQRWSFFQQIRWSAKKLSKEVTPLSRLMPISCKRRLLMTADLSVLSYSAEVWEVALDNKIYWKRFSQVQKREARRVVTAYRTVYEAAGVNFIDLLVKERRTM